MSHLPRRICQLKKLPANEITEPLEFTVCKLELRGKARVLHSRFRRTLKETDVQQNKKKSRSNCRSVITRRQAKLDGHEIFDIGSLY